MNLLEKYTGFPLYSKYSCFHNADESVDWEKTAKGFCAAVEEMNNRSRKVGGVDIYEAGKRLRTFTNLLQAVCSSATFKRFPKKLKEHIANAVKNAEADDDLRNAVADDKKDEISKMFDDIVSGDA